MATEPVTIAEWQQAVDAAYGALALDAARKYGLVTGGPTIHISRCQELLRRARRRGIVPAQDAIERFTAALLATRQEGTDARPAR